MTALKQPTYYDVSRHLDIATTNRIRTSRVLPYAWEGNAKLTLAHGLYWDEHDALLLAACQLAEHHRQERIARALEEKSHASYAQQLELF